MMTRRYTSPNLADAATQLRMLRVTCEKCGRFGQYRVDKLIEKHGPDITLPDLSASRQHVGPLSGRLR
jgi:hypothetical protein